VDLLNVKRGSQILSRPSCSSPSLAVCADGRFGSRIKFAVKPFGWFSLGLGYCALLFRNRLDQSRNCVVKLADCSVRRSRVYAKPAVA
jgi:hypothetical protein